MIEQLGNGLLLGVIIALGSVALSLLYGVTRIVNFAHGEIIAFGAMMTLFFSSSPDSSLLFLGFPGSIISQIRMLESFSMLPDLFIFGHLLAYCSN